MKPTDYPHKDEETWMREVLTDFRIPFDDHQTGRRLALTYWMKNRNDAMRDTCACSDFKEAQESGTDNEGYSRLIRHSFGGWSIGSGLQSITFCPWCGKRLP